MDPTAHCSRGNVWTFEARTGHISRTDTDADADTHRSDAETDLAGFQKTGKSDFVPPTQTKLCDSRSTKSIFFCSASTSGHSLLPGDFNKP